MRVDTKQIDLAILKIFYDNDVKQEGGLSVNSLLDAWTATQLREKDLFAGLRHLSQLGHIRLVGEQPEALVILTRSGYARTRKLKILLNEMTNLMTSRYLGSLLKRFVGGTKSSKSMSRKSDAMVFH